MTPAFLCVLNVALLNLILLKNKEARRKPRFFLYS